MQKGNLLHAFVSTLRQKCTTHTHTPYQGSRQRRQVSHTVRSVFRLERVEPRDWNPMRAIHCSLLQMKHAFKSETQVKIHRMQTRGFVHFQVMQSESKAIPDLNWLILRGPTPENRIFFRRGQISTFVPFSIFPVSWPFGFCMKWRRRPKRDPKTSNVQWTQFLTFLSPGKVIFCGLLFSARSHTTKVWIPCGLTHKSVGCYRILQNFLFFFSKCYFQRRALEAIKQLWFLEKIWKVPNHKRYNGHCWFIPQIQLWHSLRAMMRWLPSSTQISISTRGMGCNAHPVFGQNLIPGWNQQGMTCPTPPPQGVSFCANFDWKQVILV